MPAYATHPRRRSTPASTAASASRPAPPTSPPATRPTARAAASCSCARSSAARSRPTDPALAQHLDACLGCRGCEPGLPLRRGYGAGTRGGTRAPRRGERGIAPAARRSSPCSPAGRSGDRCSPRRRWFRATGIPGALAGSGTRLGFGMGMLARLAPARRRGPRRAPLPRRPSGRRRRPTVALFRGCVMDTALPPRQRRHPAHARGQRLPGGGSASGRDAAARCTSTPAITPAPRHSRARTWRRSTAARTTSW